MSQSAWCTIRRLAARRDGYKCCFCGVPTAATIEHLQARSSGGGHEWENLRLACPYCNSRKGDRPLEQFVEERGWELRVPDGLPTQTQAMLDREFGWNRGSGLVATASTNAKLLLEDEQVYVLVRSDKDDDWRRMRLGQLDDKQVTYAAWAFLARHHAPSRPRRKKPSKRILAQRGRARASQAAPGT